LETISVPPETPITHQLLGHHTLLFHPEQSDVLRSKPRASRTSARFQPMKNAAEIPPPELEDPLDEPLEDPELLEDPEPPEDLHVSLNSDGLYRG